MNPDHFALVVPFLLLVLLYFVRKRQRERREIPEPVALAVAATEAGRELEALLLSGDEDAEPAHGESLRNFLRGAPTRKLTAGWFFHVFHGLLAVVLLGALTAAIIGDAMTNQTVRNIVISIVSALALCAWAVRIHLAHRREDIESRLRRVLQAHSFICAAVVDRSWKVVATAGEFPALSSGRLPTALLGRHGEAMSMYRALSRVPLPQVIVAGSDVAIADKPGRDLAVVAFTRGLAGGTNLQTTAANVSATIRAEFAAIVKVTRQERAQNEYFNPN
jgi:hypothetical protein